MVREVHDVAIVGAGAAGQAAAVQAAWAGLRTLVWGGFEAAARQADYEAKRKEQTARRNEAASQREELEQAGWESEKTDVGELVWRNPESGALHAQDVALEIARREGSTVPPRRRRAALTDLDEVLGRWRG